MFRQRGVTKTAKRGWQGIRKAGSRRHSLDRHVDQEAWLVRVGVVQRERQARWPGFKIRQRMQLAVVAPRTRVAGKGRASGTEGRVSVGWGSAAMAAIPRGHCVACRRGGWASAATGALLGLHGRT